MQIINRLKSIIAERHLLKHNFYQAWSNGELTLPILQDYTVQYYPQVRSFPRFLSLVLARCPELEPQKVLAENLTDELIHGTDHPTLWMHFAEGLGVAKERMLNEQPLPETKLMVDKFYELAERDWRDGLCALYAYESQVPDVSTSKIEGLKKFYGIQDERTLEFFTAHQHYDVGHAQQVAGLIERYVEPERAERATREAANALWGFLDGMCHISGITCN